ncbi:MAG: hypothetical protein UY87_C0025G0010 [Candidatus Peribacteria bacterium GW2011_GWC2_54_8]|nr:MAG: hypothetical protein UY87_C0025G0010 [Candidatus Peribacteria bacterium GW2011_GWC2_54_8]KKW44366.1 MAG: hypothetical protein UY90_C0012G0009 [Candidatus Peregrinibacteria bacterium GW2011_GWA2_54_9]
MRKRTICRPWSYYWRIFHGRDEVIVRRESTPLTVLTPGQSVSYSTVVLKHVDGGFKATDGRRWEGAGIMVSEGEILGLSVEYLSPGHLHLFTGKGTFTSWV